MLHFLSKTISPKSKGHSFTVSYLIHTCAFSPHPPPSISNPIYFETRETSQLLIDFFINNGFSRTKALTFIRTNPVFLHSDPLKFLQPKIDFFKSKGFSDKDIPNIITSYPVILRRSLHKEIIPCFDFFNNMFQSKHRFMKAIMRYSGILCDLDKSSAPNIKLLREEGIPESHITRLVEYFPRTLKVNPKRFKDMVEEVKELEFNPLKLQFITAIHVKMCLSTAMWTRKKGIYKRWGWTDDDISAAFRVHPFCMAISENKIEAVMDFLVNKLGCESSAVAKCPVVISMSLGKRIISRGSVILVLLSKRLVSQLNLSAMFKSAEKVFVDKFIYCHGEEADELLKLYQAKLALATCKVIEEKISV